MENDLLILLLAFVAAGFTIFFFIKRDIQVKKALIQKLAEDDEISILVDDYSEAYSEN